MAMTKADFKAPSKPHVERITLPSGGVTFLRKISARDLVALRTDNGPHPELGSLAFVYDLLWRSICDDAGNRIFDSCDDIIGGFELSIDELEFLGREALRVSGIGTTEGN